jgi:predicted ATPase
MLWTHTLLAPAQQRLLRCVSVFVGGFDLLSAQILWDSASPFGPRCMDVLSELTDHSLIVTDESNECWCYQLIGTVGAFAREQLQAAREHDLIRRALAGLGNQPWLSRLLRLHSCAAVRGGLGPRQPGCD